MTEPIVNLDKIKTEAREAAANYTNVNAACPYPFGTVEADTFKEEFLWVRSIIDVKAAQA